MDEKNGCEKSSLKCWLKTLVAGSGCILAFTFSGICEAQSAVMLPQLRKNDSPIPIDEEQGTWIASLGILPTPFSSVVFGPIADTLGRKITMQFLYLAMTVGFATIAYARNITHIYIGRIICALALGLEPGCIVYLAEITTAPQRSAFFSLISPIFTCGVIFTYIVGGYWPWKLASVVFSLMSLACFIFVFFLPESPAWLYKQDKKANAERSFKWLGRSQEEITKELELLKRSSQEETEEKVELKTFLEPQVWKPFVILSIFHILESASGIYDVLFYTVDFIDSLGTTYDPLTISIILAGLRFITTCTLGIYFTAVVSRKLATVLSGFFTGAAALGVGVYEYIYKDTSVVERPCQWVPVLLLIFQVVASTVGFLCLPWIMKAEVFPLRVRATMNSAVFVVGTAFIFVFIKIYVVWKNFLGLYGFYFSLAVPALLCVPFGIFILPETQNKTLYEIEQGFLPKKKRTKVETTQERPPVETDV